MEHEFPLMAIKRAAKWDCQQYLEKHLVYPQLGDKDISTRAAPNRGMPMRLLLLIAAAFSTAHAQVEACPWLTPHDQADDAALCEDGSHVDNWRCVLGGHGQRAKCPPNMPFMCAEKDCGGDHCCEVTEGLCAQGLRLCETTTTEEGGGSSTAVMILISVLIIILVGLILGLIMMYCWRQKRAAHTAVLATSVSTPVTPRPMQQPPPQAGQPPSTGRPSMKTQIVPTGSGIAPATIGSVPAKAPSSTSQLSDTEDPPEPPEWWTVKPQPGKQVLEPVSEDIRVKVQELMNATWRGQVTRDRAALGSGKSVKHFEVVQVNRNENTKIWQQYVQKRREIARTMMKDDLLTNVLTEGAEGMGQCEDRCNEHLLFHGSKPGALSSICENDFLLKLAGSHRGTLYGPGLYFAESSSKADEYAEDDKDGIYRGLYAMLLCRVTLGKTYYTDAVRVDEKTLMDSCIGPSASYHSVLGDREKARGTYREFIVYATAQAYPEYVVIYRRTDAAPAES